MDLKGILARIDEVQRETGLSDRALSLRATGSTETVRNWRRKTADALPGGAQTESLRRIAAALGVRAEWLIHGTGPRQGEPAGMSEPEAEPWQIPARAGNANLPEMLAPGLRHRQLWRMRAANAWLALMAGDVLVVEANGTPAPGDTVIAQIGDDGEPATRLARYAPPWLLLDGAGPPVAESAAAILGIIKATFRSPAMDEGETGPVVLLPAG